MSRDIGYYAAHALSGMLANREYVGVPEDRMVDIAINYGRIMKDKIKIVEREELPPPPSPPLPRKIKEGVKIIEPERKRKITIVVSGHTASGKTTLSAVLCNYIKKLGGRASYTCKGGEDFQTNMLFEDIRKNIEDYKLDLSEYDINIIEDYPSKDVRI